MDELQIDLSQPGIIRFGGDGRQKFSAAPDDELLFVPGLLYEIDADARRGGKMWSVSVDLKPGDKLHHGSLHGVFANEQHWAMVQVCGITDVKSHIRLITTLRDIAEYYKFFSAYKCKIGSLASHKQRMKRVAGLSRQLRPLIAAEPLFYRLVWEWVEADTVKARAEAAESAAKKVCDLLSTVEASAARMIANDAKELQAYRNLGGEKSGRSAERRYIWEPTFKLWRARGKRLGFSDNGPVMRFLRIVHEALGIEAPAGAAVRQAIDDFNGKRKPSRNAIHGAARVKKIVLCST